MVNLTRIYTRTGDQGTTRLATGQTVFKTDPRLQAYGTVDEANSVIGAALALTGLDAEIEQVLIIIQNDLFTVGADLATPASETPTLRVEPEWITRLEQWCDHFGDGMPHLRSFLLPGGSQLAAWLNIARTVVRRAERAGWDVEDDNGVNKVALQYLNRLSDLLFILSRHANRIAGIPERLWSQPRRDGASQ
ncbi:MAG: cob(I)yrinic acid a,c-diamide adenosyltransferase [Propionibacteriaceae bacterium]|jgi:cob(I)alamin adenosyltransferase|nr:cob(I)yrinic acid a,c-diamide adenosyltransferase [Propionibacteriaceae bacterium]